MKLKKWLPFGLSGAAAGIINGLFGAGGGMILVPMLIGFGKLKDKEAFATSISIILPLCLVSVFVYQRQGNFSFSTALPYLIGGLAGGLLGGLLFRKVSPGFLHKIFGAVILWGGVKLLLWS